MYVEHDTRGEISIHQLTSSQATLLKSTIETYISNFKSFYTPEEVSFFAHLSEQLKKEINNYDNP